jgi:hypothetical protein
MLESFGHVDLRPAQQPVLTLSGVVPAAGITSIAVVKDGVTLATRKRSALAPTVSIPRLPSFGTRNAIVRWRAGDRDGDPLDVEVDYSGDAGRTWRPIWMGSNTGHALVPDRYMFRATHARLRVVVNDGFQTATAISRRFRSPGAPPVARILLPLRGVRQANDAPLVLSGQAFDDRVHLLKGRALRWKLGRRLLGTGALLTISGLPAGRHRIDLLARDSFGRIGRASIIVTLRPARPVFTALGAPRSVRRTARSLRLKVASSLDAILTVRAPGQRVQRFLVSRRARTLTVRIRRGHNALTLRLSLGASGLSRTVSVTVSRR